MSTENAKDYLGHPCKTTEAFTLYGDEMDEFRREAEKDRRAIARLTGIRILKVQKRIDHLYCMLEAISDLSAENDSDSDALRALLEMGKEYARETANQYFEFAALSLVALEQGGLWKPQAEEVQHG